ncbi:hypothetical protein [Nostoc sp. C052]|uniref:hypothetical protein n=1 Tax=Nostoc sp. C052 TaxID=2576902 RepID=UPI0015C3FF88|nr:hypothetical protein [Nostoc sp. C052]
MSAVQSGAIASLPGRSHQPTQRIKTVRCCPAISSQLRHNCPTGSLQTPFPLPWVTEP